MRNLTCRNLDTGLEDFTQKLLIRAKTHFRGVVFCCRQTLINQARVHIFSKFKNHRKVDILPILLVYDTSV